MYHEPAGIPSGIPFSWNNETVADIKNRNQGIDLIQKATFLTPNRADRPFPIGGVTLVGPSDAAPYNYDNKNVTFMECTPLYIGTQALKMKVGYSTKSKNTSTWVGGAIEPYAFGGKAPLKNSFKVPFRSKSGTSIPVPNRLWTIGDCSAASSWGPGLVAAQLPVMSNVRSISLFRCPLKSKYLHYFFVAF